MNIAIGDEEKTEFDILNALIHHHDGNTSFSSDGGGLSIEHGKVLIH